MAEINRQADLRYATQNKLTSLIDDFNKLSQMYIDYTSANTEQVDKLEDQLVKYASALARNLVKLRTALKEFEDSHNEEYRKLTDKVKELEDQLKLLDIRTVKRCDYPDPPIYRSVIQFGNIQIPTKKKFSRFSKWLWKKLLGLEITDVRDIKAFVVHKTSDRPWINIHTP